MLLEIKELSVKVKSSGVKAVNGINLSVDEGEPLLILGQSGSGKTMICRALFGLTNRYNFDVSGQIFFEGKDIMSAEAKKRRKLYGSDIALIPQNPMTSFDPSCKLLFLKLCIGLAWNNAKRYGQVILICFRVECCKEQLWLQQS